MIASNFRITATHTEKSRFAEAHRSGKASRVTFDILISANLDSGKHVSIWTTAYSDVGGLHAGEEVQLMEPVHSLMTRSRTFQASSFKRDEVSRDASCDCNIIT